MSDGGCREKIPSTRENAVTECGFVEEVRKNRIENVQKMSAFQECKKEGQSA